MTTLDELKKQADELGINYKENISENTLRKRIALHIKDTYEAEIKHEENEKLDKLQKDNMKLIHIILTPNDPTKQSLAGEVFSVGNSVLGTVTRYIPFGENWLIEELLYKTIKEKEYQLLTSKPDSKGNISTVSKMTPAYSIQVLPLPTPDEINDLARIQQARKSLD